MFARRLPDRAEVVHLVVAERAASRAHAGHAAREGGIPEDIHVTARISLVHVVAIAAHARADLQRVEPAGGERRAVVGLHDTTAWS